MTAAPLLTFDPNRPKDGLLLSMCQVFSLLSGTNRVRLLELGCALIRSEYDATVTHATKGKA